MERPRRMSKVHTPDVERLNFAICVQNVEFSCEAARFSHGSVRLFYALEEYVVLLWGALRKKALQNLWAI